jgi:hypothetical protein
MKTQISTPLLVTAVILAVLLVCFIGWRFFLTDSGRQNIPTPPPPRETEGMEARPKPGGIASFNRAKGGGQ